MLMKQTSDDKSFVHAAGDLYICANKENIISTLCLDRFYLLADCSGIVL